MAVLGSAKQSPFNRDDLWGFVTMQLSIYISMLDVPAPGRITWIFGECTQSTNKRIISWNPLLFAISTLNNSK